MKPRVVVILALAAPTLAGCASLGLGGEAAPAKSAVAAAAATQAAQPTAPIAAVQAQPLPPAHPASAASAQPAPPIPAGVAGEAPPTPSPAPGIPPGASLGGVLGGPIGLSLTEADRRAAWAAQVAALDSGQSRSWRGVNGVFGFVAPGAETGGCRAYSQTIYVDGRPHRGHGVACKQADGAWKITS